MTADLDELEEEALYIDDSAEVPPADIVAFNELRSCADLFRMYQQGILQIQPAFQRDIVWQGPDQTRFIDSLIKQLPIPSMCFAQDYKKQEWMVIDGLQRIATIIRFLEAGDWKLAKLDDIDPAISGKSVAALKTAKGALHKYFTRVENQSLPINVLRCDFSKRDHMEYIFTIFHRLNTGGLKLNNQEIRNCIYGGALNDLLGQLDLNTDWRAINRMKPEGLYRFTKQELILRLFAFYDRRSKYGGQIASFLNGYMHEHRNPSEKYLSAKRSLFERTAAIAAKGIRDEDGKLPVTVLEAILVGIASNLDSLEKLSAAEVRKRVVAVLKSPSFSEASLAEGLSKKPKVDERIEASTKLFSA